MPILNCSCGQPLRVPDQNAGGRVKCPVCGAVLAAPPASPLVTAAPPSLLPPSFPPPPDEPAPRRLPVWPFVVGGVGLLLLLFLVGFMLFMPALERANHAADLMRAQNQLKQMGIAMLAFSDANGGCFPACVKYGLDNKPLWSWRVELLPYAEEFNVYQQLQLAPNDAWDSPAHAAVIAMTPRLYRLPREAETNQTCFKVFEGPGGSFDARSPVGPRFPHFFNIARGAANVILIAEAADVAHWASPVDITVSLNPDNPESFPPTALGGHFDDRFVVGMADGSARTLNRKISPHTLAWGICPTSGAAPPADW
jgi:hypothetical protein